MKLAYTLACILVSLAMFAPSAVATEVVTGMSISSTPAGPGAVDVSASFRISRPSIPMGTIYIYVGLFDANHPIVIPFSADFLSVDTVSWTPSPGGGFHVDLAASFPSVTDFYGSAWIIPSSAVCEIPCSTATGRLTGSFRPSMPTVPPVVPPTFDYHYLVENDPNGIGMDPSAMLTDVTLDGTTFPLIPPLPVGGSLIFITTSTDLPPPDLPAFPVRTVHYVLTFSDGTTISGETIGPDPCDGGGGQAPVPGKAVLDVSNATTASGQPVSSGMPGPYYTVSTMGSPLSMSIAGEPNQAIVMFAGDLNCGFLDLGPFGQLDVGPGNLHIVADGNQPTFPDAFFRTGPTGQVFFSFPSPNVQGLLTTFQAVVYNNQSVIQFSNTVSIAVL